MGPGRDIIPRSERLDQSRKRSPLLDLAFTRLAEPVGCSSLQSPVASRRERSRMWTIAFRNGSFFPWIMFCSSILTGSPRQGTTGGFQDRSTHCAVNLSGDTREAQLNHNIMFKKKKS
ncbi:hypothetical protein BDW71DRAFT_173392 [Aspergillus fruticulosus]